MFLGGTMAEGWACYATDLMDEVGFLTPDESLAQQHTRARLLARAVVDIGLHDGSLTLRRGSRAVSRSRSACRRTRRAREACKNSMFPGTAIMYWLGTDGLHRLRRERERREGVAVLAARVSRSRAVVRLDSGSARRRAGRDAPSAQSRQSRSASSGTQLRSRACRGLRHGRDARRRTTC